MSKALTREEIASRVEADGEVTSEEFVATISELDREANLKHNTPGMAYAYALGYLADAVQVHGEAGINDPGNFLLDTLAGIVRESD